MTRDDASRVDSVPASDPSQASTLPELVEFLTEQAALAVEHEDREGLVRYGGWIGDVERLTEQLVIARAQRDADAGTARALTLSDVVAWHEEQIAKMRRLIAKSEDWSAANNDGDRSIGGGTWFTKDMPRYIAAHEKSARHFRRLARKESRMLAPLLPAPHHDD